MTVPAFLCNLCISNVSRTSYILLMSEIAIIATQGILDAVDMPTFVDRELTAAETETLNFHLSRSRSANTRKAYEYQWRLFVSWCFKEGFVPFPATVEVVSLYLSHLNDKGMKLSKIEQSLSAIKAVHHDNDSRTALAFNHSHIKAVLSSIRRAMAADGRSKVDKPRHFSQAEIKLMVGTCDDSTPQGVQDRAILLLGFNAGLRASEYCALAMSDIVFDEAGVDVTIRSSKSDQFGTGATVFIGRQSPHLRHLDAVQALSEWMRYRETYPAADGSLFIAFRKGGQTPHLIRGQIHGLTREAITNTLVRHASAAGLEPGGQTFSSHSMRHSFITQAFSRNIDAARISKTSRHRNLTNLLEYDQSDRRESSVSPVLWN